DVKVDHDVALDITLEPLDAPTLRTIGHVTVDGRLAPLRGVIPAQDLSRADMARMGQTQITQSLLAVPSVTFARPDGGGDAAIATVALRGPDPSETLVGLDGQLLNDANTGDIDLSRFPVAAFSSVDLTEGLGPQDSEGSNTIGGAINLVSLRPTHDAHVSFMSSAGSFGSSEQWINATGTRGRLGYAFAVDNQHEAGYVNQVQNLVTDPATNATTPVLLGSGLAERSLLGNLTYAFSQRSDISARYFVLGDARDTSSSVNGIDGDPGSPTYGEFIGPGPQSLAQTIRAYLVHGRVPLGAGELVAEASTTNDSLGLLGGAATPYDVTHQDKRSTGSLQWGRTFDRSEYAFGALTRYEAFDFVDPSGAVPALGQSVAQYFARGSVQATKELQLQGGLYGSRYSSFGSQLDGRLGAIYNLTPQTALRFSVGTGFRAPLLIERYVFPVAQLTQDARGVWVGQGNPNEGPERATEYELGLSQRFTHDATIDVSVYRTNLRNPIENYYPLALANANVCSDPTKNSPNAPDPACFSYPINVGNAVYQGAEVRFAQRFTPGNLFLTASYGLNVAYPFNLGDSVSNPTSGGDLVNGQQFLGIPQQQGSLQLDWTPGHWHSSVQAIFRGKNNELGQGPLTFINAAVGLKVNDALDVTLAATNLFNDGAGRYTLFGGGVPYNGVGGPLPTDRLATTPASAKLLFTFRE
ncbi:MAG: TonB-dependent receptor, partial [bacterium]|nr:TonB-dependent receptor [bacterium]